VLEAAAAYALLPSLQLPKFFVSQQPARPAAIVIIKQQELA
jgi:hypothetical protein